MRKIPKSNPDLRPSGQTPTPRSDLLGFLFLVAVLGSVLVVMDLMCAGAEGPMIPQGPVVSKPATNVYRLQVSWNGVSDAASYVLGVITNGVTNTISTSATNVWVSNLFGPPDSMWVRSVGSNGVASSNAIWVQTNYARALFATAVTGPWSELPATTMAYPPGSGFLQWSNFWNWRLFAQ